MRNRNWVGIALTMALVVTGSCGQEDRQTRAERNWTQQLKSSDPAVRKEAVVALSAVARQNYEHLDLIIACLSDNDGQVRAAATNALAAFPVTDAYFVDKLLPHADPLASVEAAAVIEVLEMICAKREEVRTILANRLPNAHGPQRAALLKLLAGNIAGVVPLPDLGPAAAVSTAGLLLARVPAGSFVMGSPVTEAGRKETESQHTVTLSRSLFMSVTEVTQEQYERVMEINPANNSSCGRNCPVENVSWHNAVEFCNRLSQLDGFTPCYRGQDDETVCDFSADGYRLPTEAEWEYACRAGTTTPFNTGNAITMDQANFNIVPPVNPAVPPDDYPHRTLPTGRYMPNAWGLLDMHGNVWEWCWDWDDDTYYSNSPDMDPSGPEAGQRRIIRGGSWNNTAEQVRSALRFRSSPRGRVDNVGFRVVRSAP